MDNLNLDQYVGKEIIVKGADALDVTCKLEGWSEAGILITASEKARGVTFRNRFYPWARIEYLDLTVSSDRSSRVA